MIALELGEYFLIISFAPAKSIHGKTDYLTPEARNTELKNKLSAFYVNKEIKDIENFVKEKK